MPDLTRLDLHKLPLPDVCACSCVPCKHYEVSLDHGPCVSCRDHAKFENKDFDPVKERDAAYDLGYKDAQKSQGYWGHENGCDCAVCEDMTQINLSRTIVDAEWNKLLDENATLTAEIERLRERSGLCGKHKIAHFKCGCPDIVDVRAERDKYREALQEVASVSGIQQSNMGIVMKQIANRALTGDKP